MVSSLAGPKRARRAKFPRENQKKEDARRRRLFLRAENSRSLVFDSHKELTIALGEFFESRLRGACARRAGGPTLFLSSEMQNGEFTRELAAALSPCASARSAHFGFATGQTALAPLAVPAAVSPLNV